MGDDAPIEVEPSVLERITFRDVVDADSIAMFNALLTAGKKNLGMKQIQKYKSAIVKFTVATKALILDEKLATSSLSQFDTPINSCGNLLVELLNKKKDHPKAVEVGGVKPALLSAIIGEMWGKMVELVTPYFESKDIEKASEAVKFFSSSDFVSQFLNDKEFKTEKRIMASHARKIKSKLIPPCKKKDVKLQEFKHLSLLLDPSTVHAIIMKG